MIKFFFVITLLCYMSLYSMEQDNKELLNPHDIIDSFHSYNENCVDGVRIFKNEFPYYERYVGLEVMLPIIRIIQPYMNVLSQYQDTPFRESLFKLFERINSHQKSERYHEFLEYAAPFYSLKCPNVLFIFLRNKIYENVPRHLALSHFSFIVDIRRSCYACKKDDLLERREATSFILDKEEHLCSAESLIRAIFAQYKQKEKESACLYCNLNIQIVHAPSILCINNARILPNISLSFSLEPFDLSDAFMQKEQLLNYDLIALLFYNFDNDAPSFCALVKEGPQQWIMYYKHYSIKIEYDLLKEIARAGSCRTLEKRFFPLRFFYLRSNDHQIPFDPQSVLNCYKTHSHEVLEKISCASSINEISVHEMPYSCTFCSMSWENKQSYKKHMIRHNPAYAKCHSCYHWYTKSFLNQHIQEKHNKKYSDDDDFINDESDE